MERHNILVKALNSDLKRLERLLKGMRGHIPYQILHESDVAEATMYVSLAETAIREMGKHLKVI